MKNKGRSPAQDQTEAHIVETQGQCLRTYPGSPWVYGLSEDTDFVEALTQALLRLDPNKEPQRVVCVWADDDGLPLPFPVPEIRYNDEHDATWEGRMKQSQGVKVPVSANVERVTFPALRMDAQSTGPDETTHRQRYHDENGENHMQDEITIYASPSELVRKRTQTASVQKKHSQGLHVDAQRPTVDVDDSDEWENWAKKRKASGALSPS
ncbi:hypothetical protein SVAN01_04924 [Stagonosporopsis vannaccii]|nr:hypothetical protein SVAN01_04924 [Stagonosporopsis vannaccii]